MTLRIGATLSCDGMDCDQHLSEDTAEAVRESANRYGWVRVLGGDRERDYCGACAEKRARRKRLAEVMPAGTVLLGVFDAARAAGFTVSDDRPEAKVSCCGTPVEIQSWLGDAVAAHCKTCGAAIADVTGPVWSGGGVSFVDPDKINVETEARWVVVVRDEGAVKS